MESEAQQDQQDERGASNGDEMARISQMVDRGYAAANEPVRPPAGSDDAKAMAVAAYYASMRALIESTRALAALAGGVGVPDEDLDLVDRLVSDESVAE